MAGGSGSPVTDRFVGASAGVLDGNGTEMVHLTVPTGPAPSVAPPDLAGAVHRVTDRAGSGYDWVPTRHPGHDADDLLARYHRWRRDFAADYFLAERGFLRTFIDWADHHGDASALHVLRLTNGHIDVNAALRMRWQADGLRKNRLGGYTGIGIFAGGHAPVRGIMPADGPTVLLTTQTAAVVADRNWLLLADRDATGAERHTPVEGWEVAADGSVTARIAGGPRPLGASAAGRLLRALGRGAAAAEVRPVELRVLAAPLLMSIADAARQAGDCGTGLYVRAGGG
jgi:hypothetical protein